MSTAATASSELRVRVARKATEALDICSLDLVAESGSLPPFGAGAHIDVHLPGGLVRQYSLCNAPSDAGRYQISVLRDANSRGGSVAVHEAVHEGDVLIISVPKNHFPLADDATQHLLLGGGIGVTPLLAMAEKLQADGAPFTLHHCTRSHERTAFLARVAAAPYAAHVQHHFDDGEAAQKLNIAATLQAAAPGTHLYVCGPQGFMDAVLGLARAQAWPEAQLHYEFFGAAPVDTAGDGSFELEIASSGQVIKVQAQQTALQALQAAGLDVLASCEQGVCGTCLTGVQAGTPEHRDHYLTPEEKAANDQFLPCCSRACSPRLVLAL
jgi:vanillate O-demethylase ferredoxin subunit